MVLHADFPIVRHRQHISPEWSIHLPTDFNRRHDDDNLVFWRPDLTIWLDAWDNAEQETQLERLHWLRTTMSPDAFDIREQAHGPLIRLSYRLAEDADHLRLPALYCYAIGQSGHLEMAFYFDHEGSMAMAEAICESIVESAS